MVSNYILFKYSARERNLPSNKCDILNTTEADYYLSNNLKIKFPFKP